MRTGWKTEVKAREQLLTGLGTREEGQQEKAVACGISDCSFGRTGGLM